MQPAKSSDFLILFALWLMVFSSSSQVMIISPLLPGIGAELQMSVEVLGTLVTAYAILLSVFALVTGPISDKIGRRRILLIGCGLMSVVLFLHGLADSYAALLTVRALAGAAGGMLSGGAVAYVGDYYPYERRGWANGWVMSGIAAGQILGIPAGRLLADWLGFRWPFLVFAFTMALATLIIWRWLPQPNVQRDRERLSVRRALVNYGRLLQQAPVVTAVAAYFLMFFSIGLYVVYLPTWLETVLHASGLQIASLFFVGGLANVVTGPLAGRASDRMGRKPLVVVACAGMGVVMLATTYVIVAMWAAYVLFALAMMTVAMRISPLQSLLTALVPDERRGILMSLAISVGQVGVGLGSGAAGLTYTRYGYASNTFIGAGSILLMAFLVYRFLPEPARSLAPGIRSQAPGVTQAAPR